MSEPDSDGGLFTRDTLLLALVLLVGVAGTGVVRRQLDLLGYDELGRVVFVLGYGGMVFTVWYGWIRPLDITGPTGNAGAEPDARTDASDGAGGGEEAGDGPPSGGPSTANAGGDPDARAER